MASVWVGDDVLLSRRVAIKTLHPELALDDGLRARFRREAIAAAKLGHPDIVATYDTGEDDDVAYIVMELVDGPTLRRVIDDHGPLPVAEALRVAREVTAALDHAHRHGVIHRDIKPANVLIPTEGPVKVTDFGIAKATGASDLTRTGTVVGTARYLAPEQVEGGTSDARTDVYAVGLLLYEMLVGHLPFGGDTEMAAAIARVAAAAPAVRTTRPDVDPAVDALVARCLERDPALRYQTAAELAGALDAAGATGGSPLAPAMSSGAIPLASAVAAAAPPAARIDSRGDGHAPTTVEARPAPTDPDLPRPAVDRARPRRRRGRGSAGRASSCSWCSVPPGSSPSVRSMTMAARVPASRTQGTRTRRCASSPRATSTRSATTAASTTRPSAVSSTATPRPTGSRRRTRARR